MAVIAATTARSGRTKKILAFLIIFINCPFFYQISSYYSTIQPFSQYAQSFFGKMRLLVAFMGKNDKITLFF
jgi:hypothetical protein